MSEGSKRPRGAIRRGIVQEFALLPPALRTWVIRGLTSEQQREISERWEPYALDAQQEPDGDWRVWLIRAGRGYGKTRAGAEWVSQFARNHGDARIALVGGNADDVAKVMIDGPSGLLAVAKPHERVTWVRMRGEVRFPSGAVAHVYSAAAPEGLRGPEHHAAWCDELAKWGRGGEAAWDNLMLGLRAGARPRAVVTTTPRPNALMRRVMRSNGIVQTLGRPAGAADRPGAGAARAVPAGRELRDERGDSGAHPQVQDGRRCLRVAAEHGRGAAGDAARLSAARRRSAATAGGCRNCCAGAGGPSGRWRRRSRATASCCWRQELSGRWRCRWGRAGCACSRRAWAMRCR